MKVLFLSRWYPAPANNGSKIRISSLLRGLCERHEVTLLSFVSPEGDVNSPRFFEGPREIYTCPFREYNPRSLRSVGGLFSVTPRHLVDTHSRPMEQLIREAVHRTRFDVVIASQMSMASYQKAFSGIPAVFEEVELAAYQPRHQAGLMSRRAEARHRLTWLKYGWYLNGLLKRFRLCTVTSKIEQALVRAVAPHYEAVYVVPNPIHCPDVTKEERAPLYGSLVFTGSLRFAPNHDAMVWFTRDIFPIIKAEIPEARLSITGDPGAATIPDGPDIQMTGELPSVRPVLRTAAVSIVPIRQGGGTRVKILDAMTCFTPVVTTTKGAEGLEVRHGEHVLVADTPREFAEACIQLLRCPGFADSLARNAYALVRSRYDVTAVVPQFLQLVESAAGYAGSSRPVHQGGQPHCSCPWKN